jgi:hypothetical protein
MLPNQASYLNESLMESSTLESSPKIDFTRTSSTHRQRQES